MGTDISVVPTIVSIVGVIVALRAWGGRRRALVHEPAGYHRALRRRDPLPPNTR